MTRRTALVGDVWGGDDLGTKDTSNGDVWKVDINPKQQHHIRGKRTSTRSAAFVHPGQSYNPAPEDLRALGEMVAFQVEKQSRDIDRVETHARAAKRARGVPSHMFADNWSQSSHESDAERDQAIADAQPVSKRAVKRDLDKKERAAASLALPQAERNRLKRKAEAERKAAAASGAGTDADIDHAAKAADRGVQRKEGRRLSRAVSQSSAGIRVSTLGPARTHQGVEIALPSEIPSSLRTLQRAENVLHPATARSESLKERGIVLANRQHSARKIKPPKRRKSYNVYDRKLSEQVAREAALVKDAHPANKQALAAILSPR